MRNRITARLVVRALNVIATVALGLALANSVAAAEPIKRVLLISIDGLHPEDLTNYARAEPASALARLLHSGVDYRAALAPIPSDSYPGLLALVTGGTPRTTGIYYDEFYDRALSPPSANATCAVTGTVVRFDKSIEFDPTVVDGGGGIDPAKLPRNPATGCTPVYPHDALRVNTLFEVTKSAGGRTAWSDKHLSYEIVNGPSGHGVDDLFNPEIAANNVSAAIATTQAYDDTKVQAIRNEIRGFDHTGTTPQPVPTVFGMNFQAVTTAQVTLGNGYLDASGRPSPGLANALDHVDASLGKMIADIDSAGLRSTTAVIITAKHGQSPIDPHLLRYIPPAVIRPIVDSVDPNLVVKQNQGDGVLLWLSDPSKTQAVVDALRAHADVAGFADVLSGVDLSKLLASPQTDSRAPDIVVRTQPGVLYLAPPRIAAHGGINHDDRNVALLVSLPGLRESTVTQPVMTTQVAPTILRLLGISPDRLEAVRIERTRGLPGLP